MLRVVIIDDEESAINIIKKYLKIADFDIEVVGTANSVDEAINVINSSKPDIVFFDVEVIGGTSFDILNALNEVSFQIIFISAYNHYAIRAIRVAALDFILKPIDFDDFKDAVKKAEENIFARHNPSDQLEILKKQNLEATFDKIALPTGRGFTFVNIKDIIRCKADSNYTIFYLTDGKEIIVARTLKEYEQLLSDYDFFRVHNSHLINLFYVKGYSKGNTGTIEMSDGSFVDLSPRKKDDFFALFTKL